MSNMQMVDAIKTSVRKQKRRDRVERQLFDLALQHWLEWLLLFYAPREQGHRTGSGEAVWETVTGSRARGNTEHSNPVLALVLRDERSGYDWPASIHAIVCELPREWQLVLIGTAMGKSQAAMATAVGVGQQRVSTMLSVARGRFLIRLMLLPSTSRICMQTLGVTAPAFA